MLARLIGECALAGPIEPFLVLADWLQREGDPWGELIAIQCAPHDAAVQAELHRLLDAHGRTLCALHNAPGRAVEWQRGFVRSVTFTEAAPVDIDAELAFLDAPPAALVVRIGFADAHLDDTHAAALLRLADKLARVPVLELERNWFTHDAVMALRDAFPAASLGLQRRHQRDDGSYRALVKSWNNR